MDPFFDDIKNDILTVGVLWDENDFNKHYDAIICTDVLEHIPTEKVKLVLTNFYRCTKTLCYLCVSLLPNVFGPKIVGKQLHLTVEKPDWWITQIKEVGFTNMHHLVEKDSDGHQAWLHVFLFK